MALWQAIRPYFSWLVRFFHISYIETRSEYTGTYLGILWMPLSSLLFSATLALVFHHPTSHSLSDYFLYVMTGYTFWQFIARSITGSTDVIQNRLEFALHNNLSLGGLFAKLLIDRLFEYFINLALLAALILVLSPEKLGGNLLLFFPFLALVVTVSLATSYIVNIVTVFFSDLKTLIGIGTRFMFFASPVFWTVDEAAGGARVILSQYNPAAYFLSLPRQVFGIDPINLNTWLVSGCISLIVCVTSGIVYFRTRNFVRNLK